VANDSLLEHTIMDLWEVTRWVQYEALIYKKSEKLDNYYEVDVLELAVNGEVDKVCRKIREETQHAKIIARKFILSASRIALQSAEEVI
jgi:hypothetical protein